MLLIDMNIMLEYVMPVKQYQIKLQAISNDTFCDTAYTISISIFCLICRSLSVLVIQISI
jgi:hypothetical protein